MQFTGSRKLVWLCVSAIFVASILAVSTTARGAQAGATAAATQVEVVQVAQRGALPTGPSAVVIEHDPRLATHTIYRPATLGPSKHPVLVWGEGACAKNGLTFPEFLSEIASYGFVIVGWPASPAGAARTSRRGASCGTGWAGWADKRSGAGRRRTAWRTGRSCRGRSWWGSARRRTDNHQCRRHPSDCCHRLACP